MKKIHVAFANDKFLKSLNILEKTSLAIGGVDKFIRYETKDLQIDNFWQENHCILSQPLGAGFWIWKPFIILQAMKQTEDGDIILYTDAGVEVLNSLNPLFKITETSKDNRMLFALTMNYGTHRHSEYTKRDCFVLMGQDEPKYWNARMLNAAFSLWMKTEKNIAFLMEWQKYLKDSRVVTYEPNTCGKPNLPDYIDHRHDQAVLSLLSLKYGRELYREPTQFTINESFDNSPYGQLFNHHGGVI
jgi:hypothetical protein